MDDVQKQIDELPSCAGEEEKVEPKKVKDAYHYRHRQGGVRSRDQ